MKKQAPNYIPAIILIVAVVALTAVCGYFAFRPEKDVIQGQADVTEYRVSSKVPARVALILVEEGQFVHAGDTLALLEAPEVDAKLVQAQSAQDAAAAQSRKADKGAREEQIRGAYELWQKAIAGREVMEKSYARVKRLFDEGVATAQKLDEMTAQRDAAIATERAAKSQYDMAENGVPALNNQEVRLRVTNLKDVGSYAVWRATKAMGGYDLKTFAVKAVPVSQIKDLRPGMTVVRKTLDIRR